MSILLSFQSTCRLSVLGLSRPSLLINRPFLYQGARCVTMRVSQAKPPEVVTYDAKNMNLNRPLSPHLTIYKPQLTSMMSISHRATGLIMIGYALVMAGASFTSYDVPRLVSIIQDMHISGGVMFTLKYLLAFPVAYHMMNGIRHLAWDMGKFMKLKQVYTTGYATLSLSVLLALVFASL